jgi:Flp pilus assembly protein TadB
VKTKEQIHNTLWFWFTFVIIALIAIWIDEFWVNVTLSIILVLLILIALLFSSSENVEQRIVITDHSGSREFLLVGDI